MYRPVVPPFAVTGNENSKMSKGGDQVMYGASMEQVWSRYGAGMNLVL